MQSKEKNGKDFAKEWVEQWDIVVEKQKNTMFTTERS